MLFAFVTPHAAAVVVSGFCGFCRPELLTHSPKFLGHLLLWIVLLHFHRKGRSTKNHQLPSLSFEMSLINFNFSHFQSIPLIHCSTRFFIHCHPSRSYKVLEPSRRTRSLRNVILLLAYDRFRMLNVVTLNLVPPVWTLAPPSLEPISVKYDHQSPFIWDALTFKSDCDTFK